MAKCVDAALDPGYFYPTAPVGRPAVGNEGDQLDRIQRERAQFCSDCNYKQQCLEMGLYGQEPGVWGGTTEADRRVMFREIHRPRVNFYSIEPAEMAVG